MKGALTSNLCAENRAQALNRSTIDRLAFSRPHLRCRSKLWAPRDRRGLQGLRRAASAVAALAPLKEKFEIPGFVELLEGEGGLPKVVLQQASGSSVEIYLYGANITSWKQPSKDEVLFVRPDSKFDKAKPISGGIPHCFPQFGPGKMQQHGFARNLDWEISATSADPQPDDRDPEIELVLTENDYTTAMFPYKFRLVYTVTLHGEQLRTDYRVINTDEKEFSFTSALHSYFEVLNANEAKVYGLQGLTYLDKTEDPQKPKEKSEDREFVSFGKKLVDNVYFRAPEHVELHVGTGAAIALEASGWSDVVVWNPYTSIASFEKFVCVENAQTSSEIVLKPEESWRATTCMYIKNV